MAAQSYSGSCHCGAVAFTVEVDPSTAMQLLDLHQARRGMGFRAQGQIRAEIG
jgi:hypothetical protein